MAALEATQAGARFDDGGDIRTRLVGTWDWDILNDRVYAEGSFARLFGLTDQQAAQGAPLRVWLDAIHPDDLDQVSAMIRQTMKPGEVFSMEYRVVAHGETHWIYARGNCTFDQAGEPVRFPGAVVDITHEKIDDRHLSIAPI
ncbi:PAS domain-containing protein [Tardiphaga alba]|nr:PAS domain-containing protein [Tardiphaga alba]